MTQDRIYTVFTRNWWRKEGDRLVPDPSARKTVLRRNLTKDEARGLCEEWNNTHNPGKLSRKAEFTSNY